MACLLLDLRGDEFLHRTHSAPLTSPFVHALLVVDHVFEHPVAAETECVLVRDLRLLFDLVPSHGSGGSHLENAIQILSRNHLEQRARHLLSLLHIPSRISGVPAIDSLPSDHVCALIANGFKIIRPLSLQSLLDSLYRRLDTRLEPILVFAPVLLLTKKSEYCVAIGGILEIDVIRLRKPVRRKTLHTLL